MKTKESKARFALAEYAEAQAWWRNQKADEYPNDARNSEAARWWYGFQTEVNKLADSDPVISVAIDAGLFYEDADEYHIDESEPEFQRAVRHLGYGYRPDIDSAIRYLAGAHSRTGVR